MEIKIENYLSQDERKEIGKPEKFDLRYTFKACQWILENKEIKCK